MRVASRDFAARIHLLLAASLGFLGGACSRPSEGEGPAMVFAAASLTEPFQALAREFEQDGREVELHFAGTPSLVLQIREGAPADVLASADLENMAKVVDAGHAPEPPRVFATNRLAVVIGKGNPKGIHSLADLERADLKVLLCGPEVPAGRYARQALAKASLAVRSVSDEPSVKSVLSKVELGEVDAGLVYVTDAASAGGSVDSFRVPDACDVVASYPIAVLSTGRVRETAEEFVSFVLSPRGQSILGSFGFQSP